MTMRLFLAPVFMLQKIIRLNLMICLVSGVLAGGVAHTQTKAPSQSLYAQDATPLAGSPPLNHLFGKPAIVIQFQPYCTHCKALMHVADDFAKDRPDYNVFAVSEFGSKRALEAMLANNGIKMPAFRSSNALLAVLGNLRGSPRTYLIDEYGLVRLATKGWQSRNQLENFVLEWESLP